MTWERCLCESNVQAAPCAWLAKHVHLTVGQSVPVASMTPSAYRAAKADSMQATSAWLLGCGTVKNLASSRFATKASHPSARMIREMPGQLDPAAGLRPPASQGCEHACHCPDVYAADHDHELSGQATAREGWGLPLCPCRAWTREAMHGFYYRPHCQRMATGMQCATVSKLSIRSRLGSSNIESSVRMPHQGSRPAAAGPHPW